MYIMSMDIEIQEIVCRSREGSSSHSQHNITTLTTANNNDHGICQSIAGGDAAAVVDNAPPTWQKELLRRMSNLGHVVEWNKHDVDKTTSSTTAVTVAGDNADTTSLFKHQTGTCALEY
jgi:hypothetical protein